MGILSKLFGKKQAAVVTEAPPCPHAVMVPRWDNVRDMGQEALATRFMCEACHQEFTPAEAQVLKESSVADRLIGQAEAEQA